jgi:uncharacterized protein YfaS (alpha-2-macroglobulin family)
MKSGLKLPSVKIPQTWLDWMKANKKLGWYFSGLMIVLVVGFGVYSLFFNRGVTLVGMSPAGEISPKTNLTFTFSADMVAEQEVGTVFRGSLIRFNPEIPGKYRWISRRELEFLPEAPFRPSTRYQLELRPDLAKDKDKYLTGKRNREFSTHRFKVNKVGISYNYPPNQKKGIQMQARIEFNYPVAPQELQKALRLSYERWGREIKYNISPNEKSALFTLTSEPLSITGKDRKVELNIPKGFRCIGGDIGLATDYTSKTSLGAKKELKILEVTAKTDSSKCWISVHCSEPVEAGSVANFIQITPEVAFKAKVDGEYILIHSEQFKPGDSYNLRLAAGLPALNGFPLKREHAAAGVFVDLEPTLKFNSIGRYLSSKGFLNLGLETVNVAKVNLEISRIYANNLVNYLNSLGGDGYYDEYYESKYLSSYRIPEYGQILESKNITIAGGKNETITTPIGLGDFFSGKHKGIFQVVVYDNNYRWRQDSKYVIITDLGILAKMGGDELTVWVNSLETLEPKSNTKVSLISRNNQTIAVETTDNNGLARFKQLEKIAAGFDPYIILAEKDNDFSFVNLTSSLISTTDFDVRGRTGLESGYEAFLYMDRDVFRPGDKGNLVGVIRGPKASMPGEFPVILEIKQPDGQIFKQLQGNTGTRGVCEFGIEIPDYAQTGKYSAILMVAERAIGETTFSVEEFMPERIKVTAKTDKNEYHAGETAGIKIEGITLFGPPAAGRRTKLRVKVEPEAFNPPGYQSYSFGDSRRTFTNIDEELGDDELDQNGLAGYHYTVPRQLTPPAKLKATFQATVIEEGGRAVSSYKVVALHPYDKYIGIKPLVEEYGEVGKPYHIKYVALNPQGEPVPNPELKVEVYHVTWNSVYRKDSEGRYTYVSEEERNKVYSGPLPATAGPSKENGFQYTPKDYGRFEIVIADSKSEARASLGFYASGWGFSPWAMESPEKIQLDLEQKIYRVGSSARLQIKAPFSGKALVTIERGRVYDHQIVNLKKNTGVVSIPVKAEYQPNVYVSVHLIRPAKSLEKNTPVRAFGTIPLMVDCSNHNLNIQLKAPAEIRPNREIEVQVNVNNAGNRAYLTLAAVDEGICQLTNYAAPNPMEFFYGKRALAIESYDIYGMVLPEVAPIQTKGSPGGGEDEESQIRRQNLNPVSVRRVKPVSLWSGLVKLQSGTAKVKFSVPQFNGTLRLMAVVSSAADFGSAQRKILVRDPIVLTPTLPRFVAPQDQFTVPVSVFNGTGRAGDFRLMVKAEGPVEFAGDSVAEVNLTSQEEKLVRFRLKAKNAVGKLAFKLTVQGNGQTCEVSEELAVRPAAPLTHHLLSGTITAQKPLNLNLEANWLPGTADYSITLAPFPAVKFAGSLLYLLTYPHGCVEQTTSRVMPLLYFEELAKATATDVFKGGNPDYYINQGIAKLESMQLWDGGFSYWPGGNYGYDWSSIYASHFLIEARKAGFTVSDRVYNRMISNLIKIAKSNHRDEYHLQTKVYALYALSLAGKPQTGVMSYLKNFALNDMSLYSRAQLAASYFYAGDRNTAQNLLPVSFAAYNGSRETGGNFNSGVRADAIILSVLADVEPSNPAVPKLVDRISKEADAIGYWGTTQENAFALMAVGKILSRTRNDNYSGTLMVGNKKLADFSNAKTLKIHDRKLARGPVTIKLTGGGTCYYYIKSTGISNSSSINEYDHGITVRREFLDRYGNNINLNQVKQGELLVARIKIDNNQGWLENLAVVDMLPAGFEIENPRLGKDASFPWTNNAVAPEYMDIRDDRIMLFVNLAESGTYNFYYTVRAVTCGEFVLPSIKAECMYEPEISSYSSSGQVRVEQ